MAQRFIRGIDSARIGACFMVVVLHVAAVEFHDFNDGWWASNFYDSFTRACVPLFLMISGVLLLGRQEELPVFFRKRFARVLPPLLFWSLFYIGWNSLNGQDYGGPVGGLKAMFAGPVSYHLWYLYAIVGIYLFVPFMRHIWHAASRSEKRLYLVIWFTVSSWPILQSVLGSELDVLNTFELGSFFGLLGYLFLGAYVHEVLSQHTESPTYWWTNTALFIIFSVLTMTATWLYSSAQGQPDPLFYDYLSPFVIAAAVCAFNLLYGLGVQFARRSDVSSPRWSAVSQLAACTLGIYCVHIFVLDLFKSHTALVRGDGSGWWTIPVASVLVFAVAWALVSALRLVRPLRHVI